MSGILWTDKVELADGNKGCLMPDPHSKIWRYFLQ